MKSALSKAKRIKLIKEEIAKLEAELDCIAIPASNPVDIKRRGTRSRKQRTVSA